MDQVTHNLSSGTTENVAEPNKELPTGLVMTEKPADWCNQIAIDSSCPEEITKKIRVLQFNPRIENKPTTIDETSASVLKYQTPNFR